MIKETKNPVTTLEYTHDVDANIEDLWHTFADFPALMKQLGNDLHTEISGDGIGMQRIFISVDPNSGEENRFAERLDHLDASSRELAYTLTEGHPIGMATYAAQVRLESIDTGRTRIHWLGTFTALPDHAVEDVREQLQGSYAGMSEGLAAWSRANPC